MQSGVDSRARRSIMMRLHVFLCAALVCLLSCFAPATTRAQEAESSEDDKPLLGCPLPVGC